MDDLHQAALGIVGVGDGFGGVTSGRREQGEGRSQQGKGGTHQQSPIQSARYQNVRWGQCLYKQSDPPQMQLRFGGVLALIN